MADAAAASAPTTPGPYDHLTDEEKKYLVRGKCNFLALMLLSTIALVQSCTAGGYCFFAKRDVTFKDGMTTSQACATLNLTDWEETTCEPFFNQHGVGFSGWYITVPVDTSFCIGYDQFVKAAGGIVSPDFDSAFNAARTFSVMACIFGGFAFFTIMFASCCPMHNERLRGLSSYYCLAYICQAFTFLIFGSNVCDESFTYLYFPNLEEANILESVTCSLGDGGGLAVSATVLFFICSLLAPASLAPLPIGYERLYQQPEQQQQQQEYQDAPQPQTSPEGTKPPEDAA